MPHQVFGRNHFVLTGFGTYAKVDVFDSGLNDKAGADGAGFCAVNRIITGIDAGKVEVCSREQFSNAFCSAWIARQRPYPSP